MIIKPAKNTIAGARIVAAAEELTEPRRAGERSEAEQSASTNMAFVTVWFLEKPGTELTPVENCLRAVLELVRRRQNSNVLKVHSFPVILILNMP